MRWDRGHESPDLEDRRGQSAGPRLGGAGLGVIVSLLLRTRYGWIVIVLGLAFLVAQQSGLFSTAQAPQDARTAQTAPADEEARFVGFVLDDVQNVWTQELARRGLAYRRARLVLFTDATDTACGFGEAATGPFYCPRDQQAYIDLGFFRVLAQRLGAQGEFARAYVIAHEIGHHVQRLLGISEQEGAHTAGSGRGSVRLELQADCYAGLWAHSTAQRQLLEQGDLESALNAASRIGDDALQRQSTGRVQPESFTHGTSEQRKRWLRRGYDTGSLEACDTFQAQAL